jgi:hypothetical protein
MRSTPSAQPSQNGCVSGVGTGTALAVAARPSGRVMQLTSFLARARRAINRMVFWN